MAVRIHGIDDLDGDAIDGLLARAGELADGAAPAELNAIVGLVFFQTSLRTRVGFAAAAHRLGAHPIEIMERRASDVSMPESLEDTIRTVSGYCDALVVRGPRSSAELAASARQDTGWFNAGDDTEHPSQALIDLFAIERLCGLLGQQRVAIVGDLRMRAARSLLQVLAVRPPKSLTLVTDDQLSDGLVLPAQLVAHRTGDLRDLGDVTAVIAVGIPHGAATEPVRSRLRVDATDFPGDAVVLSPMPVIDEIAFSSRSDPRMRYFEQSDLGLFVRIAVLEWVVGRLPA